MSGLNTNQLQTLDKLLAAIAAAKADGLLKHIREVCTANESVDDAFNAVDVLRSQYKQGVHGQSWNAMLSAMDSGERKYIEVSFEDRHQMMRTINTPPSRRPSSMHGMSFSTTLYTAIAAGDCGDIRYLLAVDRNN